MKIHLERKALSAEGLRFALVVARWNRSITKKLEEGAMHALLSAGCEEHLIDSYYVPGAFELPLACKKLAKKRSHDAIIAIGCVIRGDTAHFDIVAGQSARGIMDAALETEVPIIFGVLTTDDLEQAEHRAGEPASPENKGNEAAFSAIEMAHTCREIRGSVEF